MESYKTIAFVLLSNILLAQQPVLKSSSMDLRGSTTTVKSKVSDSEDSQKDMAVKNDLKSIGDISQEAEVVLVKPLAPLGVNINFLPLYGGYGKSELQKIEEEYFIEDCAKNFQSREEASQFFSKMAWDYLAEGGKDLATHRFNLAWTLDKNNLDAYWGLGAICYQRGQYHEAIELMEKGVDINSENTTLLIDLASVYIKCFNDHQEPKELETAYNLIERALKLNPEYTNAYMQLSLVYMASGELDKAWIEFHKGYKHNPSQADFSILEQLLAHSEDPLGVFTTGD